MSSFVITLQNNQITQKKNNKWTAWLDKHWNDNTNKAEAEEQAKRLFQ